MKQVPGKPDVTGKTGRWLLSMVKAPENRLGIQSQSSNSSSVSVWGRLRNHQQTNTIVIKRFLFRGGHQQQQVLDKLQGSQFNWKLLGKQQGWCLIGPAYNYVVHPFAPCGLSSSWTRRVVCGARTPFPGQYSHVHHQLLPHWLYSCYPFPNICVWPIPFLKESLSLEGVEPFMRTG